MCNGPAGAYVLCGGSWYNDRDACGVGARNLIGELLSYDLLGFRCCVVAQQE